MPRPEQVALRGPLRWLVGCLATLAASTAFADRGEATVESGWVHQQWTVEDGLPVNALGSVLQADDGYLWIGSYDGLVRFDGHRFTVLRTDDYPALGSNRVINITSTAHGLWIRTEPGHLARYVEGAGKTGTIERVDVQLGADPSPTVFFRDPDDNLLVVATDRIYRASASGVEALAFQLGVDERLLSAAYDRSGTLWLGTVRGIAAYANGKLNRHHETERVASILPDGDQVLFFRQTSAPLAYRAGEWRTLNEPVVPGITLRGAATVRSRPWGGHLVFNQERLLGYQGGIAEVLSESIRASLMGNAAALALNGSRWWGAGNQLAKDGKVVFTLPPGMEIRALTIDREGSVWFTTQNAGLHVLRPASVTVLGEAEGLANENVYAVFEDRAGALWIGTHGGGLWRWTDRELTAIRRRGVEAPSSYAKAMAEDADGTLWVGLLGGLYRVDGDELVRAIDTGAGIGTESITDRVNALLIDRSGRLWVGTTGGLHQRTPGVQGAPPTWRSVDPEHFTQVAIRTFAEDASGGLWVGTAEGLARIAPDRSDGETPVGETPASERPASETPASETHLIDRHAGMPSNLIRALHVDQGGIVWVGTEDGGLVRIDPASLDHPDGLDLTVYDTSNGLFSNGIHHILEDGLGNLWMSSNQGIFRTPRSMLEAVARGERGRVESIGYTERDGMRNREANGGSRNAGLASRDGRLWFATQGGLAMVEPRALLAAEGESPAARIESLSIGESTRPLPTPTIHLAANERSFSIQYGAATLLSPGRIQFRYRLLGYDDAWTDAGARREAFFTRVPAGSYTFSVQTRFAGRAWEGEVATHDLLIAPRFAETWWFKTFGIAGVLLLAFGALRIQAHRQRAQRRRLEAVVAERTAVIAQQAEQLRELDRLKSDLFTNVSHEFRTPLTLTIGPLQDLLDGSRGSLPAGADEDVALALRNAHRVLDLINQILDVARLEAGHVRLRVEQLDLVPWLARRLDTFRPLAARSHISITVAPLPDRCVVSADPEQLAKVLDNLLANAFNLTPDGGAVQLEVAQPAAPAGWIEIAVRDTGPGIPPEELPRIFDRFRQVRNDRASGDTHVGQRRWSGTGIGLALAKELVELHHGTLHAESVEGQGATFVIRLRPGQAHFAHDEKIDDSAVRQRPFAIGSHHEPNTPDAVGPSSAPVEQARQVAQSGSESTADPHVASDVAENREDAGRVDEHPDAEDRAIVLVVDDEPEVRAYIRRRLRADFGIIEAEDGAEALRQARRRVPDLVVSDVMMPNLDGFGLARALKADPELAFVPIILLTAKATTGSKLTGLGEGIDDYLTKPFDGRELVARVRNLIESRRRLRQHFAPSKGAAAGAEAPSAERANRFALRLPETDLQPADLAFLDRVRDIIAEHLSDPDFGVEALAAALGCDRTYLFRKLRELIGETPSTVLRELRLERAADMLAARVGTVAEIAYGVGFKSVSHFSQRFRQQHGSTPSAYAAGAAAAPEPASE